MKILLVLGLAFAAQASVADGLYYVGAEAKESIPLRWVMGIDAVYDDGVVSGSSWRDACVDELCRSYWGGSLEEVPLEPISDVDTDRPTFHQRGTTMIIASRTGSVPEPGTFALALLAGPILLRRRRSI